MVHLIFMKSFEASGHVPLLSHAGPNIGVNRIGSAQSIFNGMRHRHVSAVSFYPSFNISVGLVSFGTRQREREWDLLGRLHPGMHHVVAVADESNLKSFQLSLVFQQCKAVGKDLAWMIEIGQGVDHRHGRGTRHFFQSRLRECAHDNHIDPAAQAARAIFWSFAHSHLYFGGREKHRMAAELNHPRLKSHPRSQTGFLKQHTQPFALEQTMHDALLLLLF